MKNCHLFNRYFLIAFIIFSAVKTSSIQAQTAIKSSFLASNTASTTLFSDLDTLPALEVSAPFWQKNREKLPEFNENGIFTGRKTEVVVLTQLDANLVQNVARQAFAKVPGISIWENDGSGIQIGVASRGLSPNRSWEFNVRQNGYDVSSDPFGYPEAYYNPPLEAVERIEVVRGAASLQFGPQFGGLLNYQLKKGATNTPLSIESRQSVGSYGLFSSFNGVGGTVGKLSYYGYYNYKTADGWRKNSAYNYATTYGSMTYAFSKKISISAELTQMNYKIQQAGGLTDAQFATDPRQSHRSRNWFSTPWWVGNLSLDYQITPNTRLSVKTFGLQSQRNSVGYVRAITILDTINKAFGSYNPRQVDRDWYKNLGSEARLQSQYKLLGQKHTLATGIRYFKGNTRRAQQGVGTTGSDWDLSVTTNNGVFPRDLNFTTENWAFFAENVFFLGEKFNFSPGFRLENLYTEGSGRLSFKTDGSENRITSQRQNNRFALFGISAEWHTTANTEIYGNIVQNYRPITFSDLTPPATTDIIDENLKNASGYSADLGYRGSVGDWLSFDASAFLMRYNNRIGTLTQERADGSRYQFRTNLGTTQHQGIEIFVQIDPLSILAKNKALGSLNLWASLAFIDAHYLDFPINSVSNNQIVADNLKNKRVENAAQHIHRVGATYSKKSLSTTVQYSYTSSIFSDANNTITPSANGQTGLIPAYSVLDWSATWAFLKHYSLKMAVNNLTDTHYFTRRAGGYPGPGLLPNEGRTFLVSLGLKF